MPTYTAEIKHGNSFTAQVRRAGFSYLLMEDGFFLLTEDGFKLILSDGLDVFVAEHKTP